MLDKKTANANIVLGLKLAILTVILFAGTMSWERWCRVSADGHDHGGGIHLPEPSAQPIITALGTALFLAGLVPSTTLWRLVWFSLGAILLILSIYLWVSDAIAEYRDLPD